MNMQYSSDFRINRTQAYWSQNFASYCSGMCKKLSVVYSLIACDSIVWEGWSIVSYWKCRGNKIIATMSKFLIRLGVLPCFECWFDDAALILSDADCMLPIPFLSFATILLLRDFGQERTAGIVILLVSQALTFVIFHSCCNFYVTCGPLLGYFVFITGLWEILSNFFVV